jgi:hypothetical protein
MYARRHAGQDHTRIEGMHLRWSPDMRHPRYLLAQNSLSGNMRQGSSPAWFGLGLALHGKRYAASRYANEFDAIRLIHSPGRFQGVVLAPRLRRDRLSRPLATTAYERTLSDSVELQHSLFSSPLDTLNPGGHSADRVTVTARCLPRPASLLRPLLWLEK